VPKFDENHAACAIVAFKDGMFSRAGHDVKLEARRLRVEVDDRKVVVVIDARSIRPVCAMREGREDHAALSARDLDTIRGYVEKDILGVDRHPEIRFESTALTAEGTGYTVEGRLTLHGRTRSLRTKVERQGDRLVVRVSLRQPEYGIRPFTALLGGLKIKPDVVVDLSIPAAGL
jgi:polyisoprenoid-binding protein YceI